MGFVAEHFRMFAPVLVGLDVYDGTTEPRPTPPPLCEIFENIWSVPLPAPVPNDTDQVAVYIPVSGMMAVLLESENP